MKRKVLVSHREVPKAGLELLATECEVVFAPGPAATSYEDLVKYAKGVDAIMWWSRHNLDSGVIDAAGPGLRAVSTMTTGYENVDVKLLKARGIPVGNVADVLHNTVADLGVALLLSVCRRLQEARRTMDEGTWAGYDPQFLNGREVGGNTVGIVGLGGVGQAFARKMSVFNIKRLIYTGDTPKPQAESLGAEFVSFNELVTESDFILISCPLNENSKNLFNENVFKKMKNTSVLLNVGQGECIDQEALVRALQTNEIGAAGLDVMVPEPLPTDHPLLSLPNCVLLPHIGNSTVEAKDAMSKLAATNILCALRGDPMPCPITL